MDLGVPSADDNRPLEVVVELAVDTTLVSALKGNGVLQTGTEWLWERLVPSKRERIQNWLMLAAGHVLWCLLLMLAGDGQKTPRSSSVCWPGHVSDLNPVASKTSGAEVEVEIISCAVARSFAASVGPAGWSGV